VSLTTLRRNVNDFIAAVGAQGVNAGTSSNLYVATLNADGVTVNVTKNGVVIFAKIFWPGNSGVGRLDASGSNCDTINIFSPDGSVGTASTHQFLMNLT
jgi:hypothetical protein